MPVHIQVPKRPVHSGRNDYIGGDQTSKISLNSKCTNKRLIDEIFDFGI